MHELPAPRTMTMRNHTPFSMVFVVLGGLLLSAVNLGCSSAPGPTSLTLKSDSSGKAYEQQFGHAYFSRGDGGQYDAVLIDDGITNPRGQGTGPLNTTATTPLSQIMHVRVLWQPLRG